ncbi:MAG: hypothetical protein QOF62_3079 [Pyrinomonadaceae bacterium]|nr:hypothetical protein [Pyrinomonadaceae bacterium]
MDFLFDLAFQIILFFVSSILIVLVFYFAQSSRPVAVIWTGFVSWVLIGLAITLLIHGRFTAETEQSFMAC